MDTVHYTYRKLNIEKGVISYELLTREICETMNLNINYKITETIVLNIKDTDIQIFNPIQKTNYFFKGLRWWLKNPAINSCILINIKDVDKGIDIEFTNNMGYPILENKLVEYDFLNKIIKSRNIIFPEYVYKSKPKIVYIWDEYKTLTGGFKHSYFNNLLKEFEITETTEINLDDYIHLITDKKFKPDDEFINEYIYTEDEQTLYDKYDIQIYEDIDRKELIRRIKSYDYDNIYITKMNNEDYLVMIKYGKKIIIKTFVSNDILNLFVNK